MNVIEEIKIWGKAFKVLNKSIREGAIFIARKNAIGDVLWTEPVIRKLASENKRIIVVTAYPELFENAPYHNVSFINETDKSYKRAVKMFKWFNLKNHLINLNQVYEKNPQQHFLHAYQTAAGLSHTEEYPQLYLSEAEKMQYADLKPYVVIHTESFSIYNHRNIYGIDWQVIINYLKAKGFTVYILSKNATSYVNAINMQTTLRQLVSLVYNASLFIGIDSGPSHIAAALQVPAIIFFGAVNPWYRHFKSQFNGIIMQQFCEKGGCYHRKEKKKDNLFCLIVGKDEQPKCSIHSNVELLQNIDAILSREKRNNRGVNA